MFRRLNINLLQVALPNIDAEVVFLFSYLPSRVSLATSALTKKRYTLALTLPISVMSTIDLVYEDSREMWEANSDLDYKDRVPVTAISLLVFRSPMATEGSLRCFKKSFHSHFYLEALHTVGSFAIKDEMPGKKLHIDTPFLPASYWTRFLLFLQNNAWLDDNRNRGRTVLFVTHGVCSEIVGTLVYYAKSSVCLEHRNVPTAYFS